MAKKKDEKVDVATDAATEEVVEKKSEAKAEKTTKKSSKAKADDTSLAETVVDAVKETAGDVVEAIKETAGDVAEGVTGSDEEDSSEKKGRKRNEKVGIVFSDKMTNTVVVRVNRMVKHQLYHKYMKKRKKFMAHDQLGASVGDRVRIRETRPLSAKKRWRVVEILQKAQK